MPAEASDQIRYEKVDRVDNYLRVLHALTLRDMRTRFAGTYWGYAVQVMWPVSHLLIITGIMVFRHAPPGFGESTVLFVASGALPALAFQYISREIMKGILVNKPLTYYPQVKALDIVFSRTIVEVVSSFLGIIIILGLIATYGVNPIPVDPLITIEGYLAAIALGIGIGTVNVAIAQFFPGWAVGYALFSIVIYISSGIYIMPSDMPAQIYYYMKFSPVVQIVEWVRLGYDPSIPITIDYVYIFLWIFGSLSLGLLLERTIGRQGS